MSTISAMPLLVCEQFMDKDMELQSVPNQFGMHGLLKIIKKENPGLTSLAVGTDFTKLGLNLTSTEPLFKTFASPWANIPAKLEPECSIPKCYNDRQPRALEVRCVDLLWFHNAHKLFIP
ncbi:NOT2/NOT3/NOT5 family [Abeliophyllum distichum]|uniref:NOT2/NOT3/NOT5 family n=1 Tax=Abeliophyllum distichum TaxID=126358 RepID=A0ABD1TVL3_9LAMI